MKTNGNCNIQKGTEMNKKLIMIWMASVPFFLHGAEYTVTPADSLQKAVQALRPGDTLTLLPGVYRQGTVAIRCRGTQESPIVIQGKEIAGHGHMGACSRKTVCLPCRLGRRYIRHFRSGKQAEHDAGAGSG